MRKYFPTKCLTIVGVLNVIWTHNFQIFGLIEMTCRMARKISWSESSASLAVLCKRVYLQKSYRNVEKIRRTSLLYDRKLHQKCYNSTKSRPQSPCLYTWEVCTSSTSYRNKLHLICPFQSNNYSCAHTCY